MEVEMTDAAMPSLEDFLEVQKLEQIAENANYGVISEETLNELDDGKLRGLIEIYNHKYASTLRESAEIMKAIKEENREMTEEEKKQLEELKELRDNIHSGREELYRVFLNWPPPLVSTHEEGMLGTSHFVDDYESNMPNPPDRDMFNSIISPTSEPAAAAAAARPPRAALKKSKGLFKCLGCGSRQSGGARSKKTRRKAVRRKNTQRRKATHRKKHYKTKAQRRKKRKSKRKPRRNYTMLKQ